MIDNQNVIERYSALSKMELSGQEQREIWSNVQQKIAEANHPTPRKQHSYVWGTILATMAALVVVAGGVYAWSNQSFSSTQHPSKSAVASKKNTTKAVPPVIFFQNLSTSGVQLTLTPAPMGDISNQTSPSEAIVYLPLYSGATPTQPVTTIGRILGSGRGFIYGTLYFKSKDSPAQIKDWYSKELHRLGYSLAAYGNVADHGKTTFTSYDFGVGGNVEMRNLKAPAVRLGFLAQKQAGETIFSLTAYYYLTKTLQTFLPPQSK